MSLSNEVVVGAQRLSLSHYDTTESSQQMDMPWPEADHGSKPHRELLRLIGHIRSLMTRWATASAAPQLKNNVPRHNDLKLNSELPAFGPSPFQCTIKSAPLLVAWVT